jgi:ribose transport system substrate-binding protein
MPNQPVETFVRIDGRGIEATSQKVVQQFLERHPKDTHILIAAANDTSALGAIAALRQLGRERHAAVVGQDLLPRMEAEMLRAGTPAIGSVSHEVHEYGPKLIDLALALLRGDKVAPYNFIEHKVVAKDQVAAKRGAVETAVVEAGAARKRRGGAAAAR